MLVEPWSLRHMKDAMFSERDNTWHNWEKSVSWCRSLLCFGNNSAGLSAWSNCINCFYKRCYIPTNYSVKGLQGFILFWKVTLYKNIYTPEISILCVHNQFYQEDVYPSRTSTRGTPVVVFPLTRLKEHCAL